MMKPSEVRAEHNAAVMKRQAFLSEIAPHIDGLRKRALLSDVVVTLNFPNAPGAPVIHMTLKHEDGRYWFDDGICPREGRQLPADAAPLRRDVYLRAPHLTLVR